MKSFGHNPVPMVLLRLRPAVISRPIHTHTHFHIVPKLNLSSVISFGDTETLRLQRAIETTPGERIVRREELVRRVFEQGARRESGGSGNVPGALPQPLPFEQRPVPAVVLRPAAPPATPEAPAPAPMEAPQSVPPALRAPSFDIERLTDRIVSNIDRRLLAHRERLGRR